MGNPARKLTNGLQLFTLVQCVLGTMTILDLPHQRCRALFSQGLQRHRPCQQLCQTDLRFSLRRRECDGARQQVGQPNLVSARDDTSAASLALRSVRPSIRVCSRPLVDNAWSSLRRTTAVMSSAQRMIHRTLPDVSSMGGVRCAQAFVFSQAVRATYAVALQRYHVSTF